MYVNPGELKKRIEIIADSEEKDSDGFPVSDSDIIIHSCRAKYTRKVGKEESGAGTEVNTATVRFLIRYTKKELHTDMRVRYAGKIYSIEDINDIGDEHRYIEIFCKQGDL